MMFNSNSCIVIKKQIAEESHQRPDQEETDYHQAKSHQKEHDK